MWLRRSNTGISATFTAHDSGAPQNPCSYSLMEILAAASLNEDAEVLDGQSSHLDFYEKMRLVSDICLQESSRSNI